MAFLLQTGASEPGLGLDNFPALGSLLGCIQSQCCQSRKRLDNLFGAKQAPILRFLSVSEYGTLKIVLCQVLIYSTSSEFSVVREGSEKVETIKASSEIELMGRLNREVGTIEDV